VFFNPATNISDTAAPSDHGIISAAIAEAATSPNPPLKGQENVSLLDAQLPRSTPPAKTQFTFTCESDTAKAMAWPDDQNALQYDAYPTASTHASQAHLGYNNNHRDFSTQGTQTSPVMSGQQANPNGAAADQPNQPVQQKHRRSPAKRYASAARDRRLQQQYNNYHHPPRPEDVWVCEFCEYEAIFGEPPVALIRQYEIKDSQERKRIAEKRRLLEKAKMKGRKNKKSTKNNGKNNAAAAGQPSYADKNPGQSHDAAALHDHDAHSDDYYPEEYDEDPAMFCPGHPEIPTRIPQPVASHGPHPRAAHADAFHTHHHA
jgi:hypothetical protein